MISYSRLRQTARRRVRQLIVVCKIKMDQKWIRVLVVLVFYQKMSSAAVDVITKELQEREPADIKCDPNAGQNIVIWYRMLDTSRMEFIGSYTNSIKKANLTSRFSDSKIGSNIITLKSFNKIQDSGTYTCAAFKSNRLIFGQVTRLQGVKTAVATKAPPTTTKQLTTTTPCACNGKNKKVVETSLSEICTPIILGPLAGSCGLLLLLLIIISVYCNRIRTRRCPHHYKRKPRTVAPEKQMMTNRHV